MGVELLHLAILETIYGKTKVKESRRISIDDIINDIVHNKKLMNEALLIDLINDLSSSSKGYLSRFNTACKLTENGFEYMLLLRPVN